VIKPTLSSSLNLRNTVLSTKDILKDVEMDNYYFFKKNDTFVRAEHDKNDPTIVNIVITKGKKETIRMVMFEHIPNCNKYIIVH